MRPTTLDIRIPEDRGKLYTTLTYPAGELQTRLTDAGLLAVIKAGGVRIVANPIPDIIELAQLIDAMKIVGRFQEITVYLPYLPFSRADRRFAVGDTFGLQVFLKLLKGAGVTNLETFDCHNTPITRFQCEHVGLQFENFIPHDDIKAVVEHIRKSCRGAMCIVLPDKGSIHRYNPTPTDGGPDEFAGLPVLLGDKIREPITGKLSGFTIDPSIICYGAALIVDDICDGGGTFIGLGEEIHKIADPIDLYLYTSHGIYSQGEQKLKQVFQELFTAASGYNNGIPKDEL